MSAECLQSVGRRPDDRAGDGRHGARCGRSRSRPALSAATQQKNAALAAAARAIRASQRDILAANARDMEARASRKLSGALLDRLKLDEKRVEAMARGIEEIIALPDPVGAVIAEWERPERPADPARARAARRHRHHLREPAERDGGRRRAVSEVGQRGRFCAAARRASIPAARFTRAWSRACARRVCLRRASSSCRRRIVLPWATCSRGMADYIDVLVPRGGKSLVERVQREARVPVIGHLEGNCHVYVDRDADRADGVRDRA